MSRRVGDCDVTVILPVHNCEEYVVESVNSILNQNNVSLRLLVFNDGSTDSTGSLLNQISDNRFELLTSSTNIGYVAALNEMLKIVRSPFIARIDADDVAEPDRLWKQLEYLQQDTSTMVLGSDFHYIDQSGKLLNYVTDRTNGMTTNVALLFENVICHPSTMLRTSLFTDHVAGYDTTFMPAEDYDLWLKCTEVGSVQIYPDKLTRYRLHPKQITGLLEKTTYWTNSLIRLRHLNRVADQHIQFQFNGMANRVKSVVAFEAEKYSLDDWTKQKLTMRYLQDVLISRDLTSRSEAFRFVKSFLLDNQISATDKIILLRFARKSLFV
jgi:glycosyltransferase involved in cell wall biosynthesis